MANKTYIFDPQRERDYAEAKIDAFSSLSKFPALCQYIQFITGQTKQITDKTIDDAFACVKDRQKSNIKASNLTKEQKELELRILETTAQLSQNIMKEYIKSITNNKWHQFNGFQNNLS